MSTAPKYRPHYTVDDYQLWEGNWELWGGVAVAMAPSPFGPHASAHVRMATALSNAIDSSACSATVLAEIDWIVARDTVLRPDLTIVCGPAPERHVEQVPALVVEVLSESTRERDLTFKKDLYQHEGVVWYLIVDPNNQTLQALRLNEGEYQAMPHGETLDIDLCNTCSLHVDVTRLFSQA